MTKILMIMMMIAALFGCADKSADETFYIKETLTNHCFRAYKVDGKLVSEWIGCKEIPNGAFVQYMQEWDVEEWK